MTQATVSKADETLAPTLERTAPTPNRHFVPAARTSVQPQVEPGRGYFGWLDCLRLIAIVEIVAFHVLDGSRIPRIGGLGLPVFLVISSAMTTVVASRRGPQAAFSSKFRKLGAAWVFWCVIYGAEWSLRIALGRSIPQPFHASMLFYGTSIHLWFVPFSIFSAFVVAGVYGSFHSCSAYASVAVLALAALALAIAGGEWHGAGRPFDQWCFAAASCPLGLMAGLMLISTGKRRLALAMGVVATVVFCLAISPAFDGLAGRSLQRLGAATLIVAACGLAPGEPPAIIRRAIPAVMGVYFVHFLIRNSLHGLLQRWPAAFVAAVLGGSVLAVAILSRTRLRPFVMSR